MVLYLPINPLARVQILMAETKTAVFLRVWVIVGTTHPFSERNIKGNLDMGSAIHKASFTDHSSAIDGVRVFNRNNLIGSGGF